jgi:hypothetical protein
LNNKKSLHRHYFKFGAGFLVSTIQEQQSTRISSCKMSETNALPFAKGSIGSTVAQQDWDYQLSDC